MRIGIGVRRPDLNHLACVEGFVRQLTPAPGWGLPIYLSVGLWIVDAEQERQRGLELGRRWAAHVSAHELATMVAGSFDDLSNILPPEVSDHFVGGFRDAVLHVWRGA